MGRLMARVYDRMMKGSEEACLREWRSELLSSVHGKVLEVGAGTGVSLPLYPTTVTRVVLSEPDRHMRAKMAQRIQKAAELPVEVSDGSVEGIPFPDESFDFVTCMLVLCSVPDLQHAVGEIRRVLVPGGSFVFLEHVAASNRPDRLKWQRRLEPFWKRISGNCHLTRKTEEAILADGFTMERVKRESMRKANPLVRSCIRGVAMKRP